jgi:hypothetical protein
MATHIYYDGHRFDLADGERASVTRQLSDCATTGGILVTATADDLTASFAVGPGIPFAIITDEDDLPF